MAAVRLLCSCGDAAQRQTLLQLVCAILPKVTRSGEEPCSAVPVARRLQILGFESRKRLVVEGGLQEKRLDHITVNDGFITAPFLSLLCFPLAVGWNFTSACQRKTTLFFLLFLASVEIKTQIKRLRMFVSFIILSEIFGLFDFILLGGRIPLLLEQKKKKNTSFGQ